MTGTVVVGTSIAGVRVAQGLRRNGYREPITLVGAEADLPYDKPPLSKDVLAGKTPAAAGSLLSEAEAAELQVTLRLGSPATRLDIAERQLHLADGTSLGYDRLVVATGARARTSPWQPGSGLHVLRSLADCQALQEDLSRSTSVVVVGAGFIGAEVASTCRSKNLEVTLVDPMAAPMLGLVGSKVSARAAAVHQRHGVITRFGVGVEAVCGEQGALKVELTDGTVLDCDTVVVGIGAQPNSEWLADSGLVVDDGVVCDAWGRTSAPGVFAIGDVARWADPRTGEHRRIEHWTNAVEQSACVAAMIAEIEDVQPHVPTGYVWSDQYDWRLQLMGRALGNSYLVTEAEGREVERFAALYSIDGETVCGAVVVNAPRVSLTLRRALPTAPALEEMLVRVEEMLAERPRLKAVPSA